MSPKNDFPDIKFFLKIHKTFIFFGLLVVKQSKIVIFINSSIISL